MSLLSLSCSEWDGEGWAFVEPDDFTTLQTHRRQRCKSCGDLIPKGAVCLRFVRMRYATEWEYAKGICSEDTEIELASYYHCEKCGDQFMNLTALGFCPGITENMMELVKEYAETYGPQKVA